MHSLIQTFHGENLKLYARPSTRIMIAALSMAALFATITDRLFSPMRLGFWDAVAGQSWVLILVMIFAIVAAGGIVANEFAWGTIKLLLVHPVSSGRILAAKYLAVAAFVLALMSLLLLILVFLNGLDLALGGGAAGAAAKAGSFETLGDVLVYYLLRFAQIFVYAAIALMLSAVSRSNAFAIGASFFAMLLGPELGDVLAGTSWSRYILFNHINLTVYMNAGSTEGGSGLGYSLLVIGVYLAIFHAVAWMAFAKRDVLA
ncbi:MAG: ABC transporter permease [Bacteroidota bacterium]